MAIFLVLSVCKAYAFFCPLVADILAICLTHWFPWVSHPIWSELHLKSHCNACQLSLYGCLTAQFYRKTRSNPPCAFQEEHLLDQFSLSVDFRHKAPYSCHLQYLWHARWLFAHPHSHRLRQHRWCPLQLHFWILFWSRCSITWRSRRRAVIVRHFELDGSQLKWRQVLSKPLAPWLPHLKPIDAIKH